jgi:hypothetical protein
MPEPRQTLTNRCADIDAVFDYQDAHAFASVVLRVGPGVARAGC